MERRELARWVRRGVRKVTRFVGRKVPISVGDRLPGKSDPRVKVKGSFPIDLRALSHDPVHASYVSCGRPHLLDIPVERIAELPPPSWSDAVAKHREGAPRNVCIDLLRERYPHEKIRVCLRPWVAPAIAEVWESHSTVESGSLPMQGGDSALLWAVFHFDKLRLLSDSIRRHGYRRASHDDGDISGVLLLDGDEWRAMKLGGTHRMAVLIGHDVTVMPMKFPRTAPSWAIGAAYDGGAPFPPVVRRGDATHWPQVVGGRYTPSEALSIFDELFTSAGRSGG